MSLNDARVVQMPQLKVSDSIEIFVAGDKAVEPAIPQGARLYCSAKLEPQSGDFVVFSPNDGSPHFVRQYVIQQDGTLLLHAPNRNFDSYVSNPEELDASGRLLPILRLERDLPAAQRAGGLPQTLELGKVAAPVQGAEASQAIVPPSDTQIQDASGLLTFDEAKAALKVRRTKMYELLRMGELRALKVGKLWRIERSSIAEYLKSSAFKKAGL